MPKDTVVFLTENELFKRKYSSVNFVLKSYFCTRDANGDQKISLRRKERRKIIKYLTALYTKNSKRNIYALDTMNHYRFCASKSIDRKNVRSINNKLSEAGYEYSVLCNLKEYDWSISINIKRVGSSDNKYDIGVGQILNAHSCGEQDSITISVGDVAYSNCGYIEPLYNKDNLISLTRDKKIELFMQHFLGIKKSLAKKDVMEKR